MNSIRGLPRGSANVFRHFLKQARKDQQWTHSHPIAGGVFWGKKALAFVWHRATRHGHEKQSQETKANEV
jgi:hypothetical protein